MKHIFTILISLFLLPVFGQTNDSIQKEKDNFKKLLADNKFKEVKLKTDIPLDILKLIGINSYEKIDGDMTALLWAEKSKNNIWILSFRLVSCGYYYEHFVINNNTAKAIQYNNPGSFKEFKTWGLKGQP